MKYIRILTGLLLLSPFCSTLQAQQPAANISVHLTEEKGPMKPIWAWFGYDEPNYTYMKDGKKLLTEIAALSPTPVYVRAHSLLCTGDGTAALKWGSTDAYKEDAQGNPIYNWRIVDSIFDTYIDRGMKPLAQIGFMPQAMSTRPEPYRHYWKPGDKYDDIFTGWAYPPKDYNKWRELVYQWVKHSVERYGQKEVESWYWEVWNEPNYYFKGTREEFFKLYDYAADGLKKALPTARIGGLNVAGTKSKGAKEWMDAFIRHCLYETNYATGQKGSPLEAFLFHAKGEPKLNNGVVWMNMAPQLKDIQAGMLMAKSFPETANLPLIVGESDPEGCAACGMATNPSNAYRNGTMYSSYTAASFARKYELAERHNANLAGAVSWSFEFEDQPWFFGFRDLATNGVDKPVLNVFRMFGLMHGTLVKSTSDRMYPLDTILASAIRNRPDIGVLASKNGKSATVMVWNYHDADSLTGPEKVRVNVTGIPATAYKVTEYRIDQEHSNSYTVWKKMGSPQKPTAQQIATLEKAGQLATMGKPTSFKKQQLQDAAISISLPRQAVSLLKIEW
ncbi:beta-xylosidase [uncultured Chitinophaga sp.]|uniref:GH39 family glycosyl hydrolase n=1 Tax=uncultured Chitinophaga sp. TaxID=339340 RepID=UPI0025FCAA86|nr:beta-xylosidase [uncultured Chitinophaga sp.]